MSLHKIAFVSTASNMSGATLALLETIDALKKRGIESIVFTASRGPLEDKLSERKVKTYKLLYYSYLTNDGELESFLGKLKWKLKAVLELRAEKEISEVLKQERPDVLHINTGISPVGIDSAKEKSIPVVWHIREVPEVYWNRNVFDYNVEKDYLRKADKVICISKYIYDIYSKKSPINAVIIYDGVNTEGFEKLRKHEIISGKKVKLSLCGYDAFKGHEDAIKALGILHKEGIDNLELTIWGNVEESYKKNLQNMINKLDVEKQVRFGGHTNNMSRIWADTDIALMCSRGEAFGRVTVEAMAAGALAIGSNIGATKEILSDGKGLLYDVEDDNMLAHKIRWSILNQEKAKKIAKKGQLFILDGNYSMDKFTDKLLELYGKITKN